MQKQNLQSQTDLVFSMEPENSIYVFRDTRYFGPFSESEIKNFLNEGLLDKGHYFWQPGMEDWQEFKSSEIYNVYAIEKVLEVDDGFFAKHVNAETDKKLSYRIKSKPEKKFASENLLQYLEDDCFTEFSIEDIEKNQNLKFKINEHVLVLPFNENTKKWVVRSALVLCGVAALLLLVKSPKTNQDLINKLEPSLRPGMLSLIKSSSSNNEPQFRVEMSAEHSQEPSFIIATNAEEGTKIKVVVKAIDSTLIAFQNFNYEEEIRISDKLFSTGNIKQVDGRYVSPGEYMVTINCISCTKTEKPLFTGKYFIGGMRDKAYEEKLKLHHYTLRKKANDEMEELVMILSTLKDQANLVNEKYLRYKDQSSDLAFSRWKDFNILWVKTQTSIVDAFKEMDNESFANELLYKDFYQKLRVLSMRLLELQNLNDKIVMNKTIGAALRQTSDSEYKAIVQQTNEIDKDLNKFKNILLSAKGYPLDK